MDLDVAVQVKLSDNKIEEVSYRSWGRGDWKESVGSGSAEARGNSISILDPYFRAGGVIDTLIIHNYFRVRYFDFPFSFGDAGRWASFSQINADKTIKSNMNKSQVMTEISKVVALNSRVDSYLRTEVGKLNAEAEKVSRLDQKSPEYKNRYKVVIDGAYKVRRTVESMYKSAGFSSVTTH